MALEIKDKEIKWAYLLKLIDGNSKIPGRFTLD